MLLACLTKQNALTTETRKHPVCLINCRRSQADDADGRSIPIIPYTALIKHSSPCIRPVNKQSNIKLYYILSCAGVPVNKQQLKETYFLLDLLNDMPHNIDTGSARPAKRCICSFQCHRHIHVIDEFVRNLLNKLFLYIPRSNFNDLIYTINKKVYFTIRFT